MKNKIKSLAFFVSTFALLTGCGIAPSDTSLSTPPTESEEPSSEEQVWEYDEASHYHMVDGEKTDVEAHDFEVTYKQEPTAITEGKTVSRCKVCEYEKTETSPKVVPQFGEWEVIKEPTYESDGLEKRTCKITGITETRVIPALVATKWRLDKAVPFNYVKKGAKKIDLPTSLWKADETNQKATCLQEGHAKYTFDVNGFNTFVDALTGIDESDKTAIKALIDQEKSLYEFNYPKLKHHYILENADRVRDWLSGVSLAYHCEYCRRDYGSVTNDGNKALSDGTHDYFGYWDIPAFVPTNPNADSYELTNNVTSSDNSFGYFSFTLKKIEQIIKNSTINAGKELEEGNLEELLAATNAICQNVYSSDGIVKGFEWNKLAPSTSIEGKFVMKIGNDTKEITLPMININDLGESKDSSSTYYAVEDSYKLTDFGFKEIIKGYIGISNESCLNYLLTMAKKSNSDLTITH